MKVKQLLFSSAAAVTIVGAVVWASGVGTKTFRTNALWFMFYQNHDSVSGLPKVGFSPVGGRDLVNWTLGTPATTKRTNEVLALQIATDESAASLVVWDKAAASVLATIATSTGSLNLIKGQTTKKVSGPNIGRFVTQMQITATNSLLGGWLTVAGRCHLDPVTGAPQAVLVDSDRSFDSLLSDRNVNNLDGDIDRSKDATKIAGRAHMIGLATVVFADGTTNTVQFPFGNLLMRRELP